MYSIKIYITDRFAIELNKDNQLFINNCSVGEIEK